MKTSKKLPVNLRFPVQEWNKKDGEVEWCFKDKPAGSRCLWTVRWLVAYEMDPNSRTPQKSAHCVEDREWTAAGWQVTDMTDDELRCELEDIATRSGDFNYKAAQLLLEPRYKLEGDYGHWRFRVEELIFQARPGYPEVIASWAEPDRLHSRVMRPGWDHWEGANPGKVKGVRVK